MVLMMLFTAMHLLRHIRVLLRGGALQTEVFHG